MHWQFMQCLQQSSEYSIQYSSTIQYSTTQYYLFQIIIAESLLEFWTQYPGFLAPLAKFLAVSNKRRLIRPYTWFFGNWLNIGKATRAHWLKLMETIFHFHIISICTLCDYQFGSTNFSLSKCTNYKFSHQGCIGFETDQLSFKFWVKNIFQWQTESHRPIDP